mmetsp:Transcript_28743/g.89066  ORF Transcript_28743/g.89066 Transcript_28743/m.89066 type:complete len:158 (-) Transcript_28743:89-562(-)
MTYASIPTTEESRTRAAPQWPVKLGAAMLLALAIGAVATGSSELKVLVTGNKATELTIRDNTGNAAGSPELKALVTGNIGDTCGQNAGCPAGAYCCGSCEAGGWLCLEGCWWVALCLSKKDDYADCFEDAVCVSGHCLTDRGETPSVWEVGTCHPSA